MFVQTVLLSQQRSDEWRAAERGHRARAEALTASYRLRKQQGEYHPVEDFLWTYYSLKPTELERWHPGAGVSLEGASAERASWRNYRTHDDGSASVDTEMFLAKRGATVDYVADLLSATLTHTPQFACFGLHEWAMVYRSTPEQLRHTRLPLRLGHEASDHVVESHRIGCSHFDAFRFFTPEAVPLNQLQPTRENQPALEQSGCLHAGMDVYKWAGKLGPIIPGSLLLDTFEFARDIREVDMRASPYDVSAYHGSNGAVLTAIPIETPEGKREYAALQRGFAHRGNGLRERVLDAIAIAKS